MRTILLILAIPSLLLAEQPRVGSTTGHVLKLDASARGAALGGAFLALADDASAAFYNPPGWCDQTGRRSALLRVASRQPHLQHGAFSMKVTEAQSLALTFGGLASDEMAVRTPTIRKARARPLSTARFTQASATADG